MINLLHSTFSLLLGAVITERLSGKVGLGMTPAAASQWRRLAVTGTVTAAGRLSPSPSLPDYQSAAVRRRPSAALGHARRTGGLERRLTGGSGRGR